MGLVPYPPPTPKAPPDMPGYTVVGGVSPRPRPIEHPVSLYEEKTTDSSFYLSAKVKRLLLFWGIILIAILIVLVFR